MSEAVRGKRIVYLFRKHSAAGTASGAVIAFTTENTRSVNKDAEVTSTKDGSIRTPGEAEVEISATSILANDDTIIDELEEAMLDDELMDIWEANLDKPVPPSSGTTPTGKFYGRYYQGYITSKEISAPSDGFVEVSLTFGVNGEGATGEVTVSEQQQEAAAYTFIDAIPSNNVGD